MISFFLRGLNNHVKNTRLTLVLFYGLILIYVFVKVEYRYFSQVQDGGHPWQTGDWLINYQSGFVRRGLMGELFFTLNRLTGLDMLWLLFSTQTIIFFSMMYFHFNIIRVIFHTRRSLDYWKLSILLLSPAGILFSLYNLDFSLRKEIIGLALINWMYFYRLHNYKVSTKYVFISLTIYTIFIFSWEAGIALLPFIITLLLEDGRVGRSLKFSDLQKFRIIFTLTISFFCFAVSMIYHGTTIESTGICNSILQRGNFDQDLCAGAVDAIGWSFSYFWAGSTIGSPLRFVGFTLLFLISCLPFSKLLFLSRHKWLFFQFGLGFFLFNILAADTGRLIYIFYVISSNQFLYDLQSDNFGEKPQKKNLRVYSAKRILRWLLPIIYISIWTLPASGNPWRFLRF